MKIGMVGVINNLSTRLTSHNAGWTYVTKSVLETYFNSQVDILDNNSNYDDYKILVINEGVNYRPGVFNFFGGVQESQINSLLNFSNYKGYLYSVNEDVDYNSLVNKRKELSHLDIKFRVPVPIDLSEVNDKLVLGDSHSISVYKPGYSISRNDGKTLFGFLKIGLHNYVRKEVKDLIFYAGNIDIRFHACRFGKQSILDNLIELEKQLKSLQLESITLVKLIPIECESRKIPGTGLYKNQPFYGSRQERTEMVLYFNDVLESICKKNNWNIIEWDFDYNNFSFDYMEARQSVHLRPSSYKNINELLKEKTDDTSILRLF